VRYDLADAVLSPGSMTFARRARGPEARVQGRCPHPGFLPTVMAATRVANIVKGGRRWTGSTDLFRDPSENGLVSAYQGVLPQAEPKRRAGTTSASSPPSRPYRDPIDRYFEDVLVWPKTRQSRKPSRHRQRGQRSVSASRPSSRWSLQA